MATVGERIHILREGAGISQKKMAELHGISQSAVNRYEHEQAEAPYKTLLWYADYFDVSMDYLFGRTDNPQGKLYKYEPETLKSKLASKEEWAEFVEACFDPHSPMYAKLKEMMIQVALDGDNA